VLPTLLVRRRRKKAYDTHSQTTLHPSGPLTRPDWIPVSKAWMLCAMGPYPVSDETGMCMSSMVPVDASRTPMLDKKHEMTEMGAIESSATKWDQGNGRERTARLDR
jgi:hypothetical protein